MIMVISWQQAATLVQQLLVFVIPVVPAWVIIQVHQLLLQLMVISNCLKTLIFQKKIAVKFGTKEQIIQMVHVV